MEFYPTSAIAKLFDVAPATVKNWSRVFSQFLSPSARPEQGKKRLFNVDDLKVFALAHEYHARGLGYDDALFALQAGQRGELPNSALELPQSIPAALLTTLREEITTLRQQLKLAESERDMERGKTQLLEKQLADKEQSIRDLYKQVARLEADRPKELKDR
jgi:DNA-binding transcriptional MerR regulator